MFILKCSCQWVGIVWQFTAKTESSRELTAVWMFLFASSGRAQGAATMVQAVIERLKASTRRVDTVNTGVDFIVTVQCVTVQLLAARLKLSRTVGC